MATDANTTFRAALQSALTAKEYQHPDGRLFVFFEVQPPIGGLLRGCSVWTPTGAVGETPPRVVLRLQAYADLLRNCKRSRRNHGSTDPADLDDSAG